MVASIDYEIVHRIFKVQVRTEPQIERVEEAGVEVHEEPSQKPVEKDPVEMTDEELDAEITRLEAQQSTPGVSPVKTLRTPGVNPGNSKPLKVHKIGRNDPCPCGSGLKWKKCGLINAPQHKG